MYTRVVCRPITYSPFFSSVHPSLYRCRQHIHLRHQTLETLHFRMSRLSQFEPVQQIDKTGSQHAQMLPKAHLFIVPTF